MAMRLGFSAWAMPAMPLADQIQLVADCGYGAIELVGGESPNALNPRTVTDAEVRAADEFENQSVAKTVVR